jgi:hypothetical protein
MSDELLISIVITNHNYGRFLADAIESALRQSHPRVETIVVDDGSTDDSLAVVAGFGDRVHAIAKPNEGQASAANAGFARARGELIIFLDADDMLEPAIAETLAKEFCAAPDTARFQYRLAVIDAAGRRTGEVVPARYVSMPSGDLREQIVRFNNPTWWPPTSGNAFSARILSRILPMPEEPFRVAVDYYLVRASTLCGPIVSLDEVGARYRRHGANTDLRSGLDVKQIRKNVRLIRDAHPHLERFAVSLGLEGFAREAGEISDLRYVALRMISLKLDADRHPIPSDTLNGLVERGLEVATQQEHLSARRRRLASLWFVAMRAAPGPLARALSAFYVDPTTRGPLNRFLRSDR